MKKNSKKNSKQMTTILNGMMTFGKTDDGLNILDFAAFEYAEMEPFAGQCKVQAMRDGNVYITELPKRVRNRAIFREDNSSLTLGRDGRFYFVFTMEESQVTKLPKQLVRQAKAIAEKVENSNL